MSCCRRIYYYPFGMEMEGPWELSVSSPENRYTYNGKEMQGDFGLDWLDYGARMYDASIGRWNAVDPLAEVYFKSSPFAYVENDPIRFLDPDGMQKSNEYVRDRDTGETVQVGDKGGDETDYIYEGKITKDEEGNVTTAVYSEENAQVLDVISTTSTDYRDQMRGPGEKVNYGTRPLIYDAILTITGEKLLSAIGGWVWGMRAAKGTVQVTQKSITKALEGSTMKTLQDKVSIPMVKKYVEMLQKGLTPPAIKVADGVIIDGNHRYIAGRLFGKEPPIIPGTLSPSQKSKIKSIKNIVADALDWGGK